jgi:transcriptional regulator with PAS, ATPase and Fis domain
VRIVAATNRDLKQRIAQGAFREDLLYRLNVVELRTPALREIREDIPLLVERFMEDLRHIRVVQRVSPEAFEGLMRYHWPGNTRQLRNVVEYALGLTEPGGVVQPESLPEVVWDVETEEASLGKNVDEARQASIERAWQECGGNVKLAAARLKISVRHFWRLRSKIREK